MGATLGIVGPLVGIGSSMAGLFDTHPPLQERIDRLQEMGGFTLPPIPKGAADA